MKNLVIVESPTKARTISQFLGKDYLVTSSFGHIRDLPKSDLGVDIDHDFDPVYEIPKKQASRIKELKSQAKTADTYLLATDPDREGEAISWHLVQALNLPAAKTKRIVFHEITKDAIDHAIQSPRQIDTNLVDAQQARRVLDRLVGYKLSPLLWKKIRYGLSAGRVQSVAVKLIVERERERRAFVPVEYWSIEALLHPSNQPSDVFAAQLIQYQGKKIEVKTQEQADTIVNTLQSAAYQVKSINRTEKKRQPTPPFTTSTLQQRAANRFGWNGKKTMQVAQKLYEEGHITYMRTDSLNLSTASIEQARGFIGGTYGQNYLPDKPNFYKTKSKGAQEAHEAIRPTKPNVAPTQLANRLTTDELKLYTLIWQRMLASQMVPAIVDQVSVDISAADYLFRATGSTIKFPGWLAVYEQAPSAKRQASSDEDQDKASESEEEARLPEITEDQPLILKELNPQQHFTQPPPRFTDATLIKALEEDGIGRPSTYAPTISTVIDRGYIERDGRALKPTDTAEVVTDLLVNHFPEIVDEGFTSKMEEELDDVAEGKLAWVPVIRAFYEPFAKLLAQKDKEIKKDDVISEKTDEVCDLCGRPMVIKLSRFGKFLSCSGYPECKNAKPLVNLNGNTPGEEQIVQDLDAVKNGTTLDENGVEVKKINSNEAVVEAITEKCPNDGGDLVLKQGRFGQFLACANYPNCKFTKAINAVKIEAKCPLDGAEIVSKRTKRGKIFFGCSNYPTCTWASWDNPDQLLAQGKELPTETTSYASKSRATKKSSTSKPASQKKSIRKATSQTTKKPAKKKSTTKSPLVQKPRPRTK